jgi:hypothetical protein
MDARSKFQGGFYRSAPVFEGACSGAEVEVLVIGRAYRLLEVASRNSATARAGELMNVAV